MPSLRVLDLSYLENLKRLPKSISNLKSIRGLLLNHCTDLQYIPSLAGLKKLRELDLQGSGVRAVPEGLEGLVNLKRLDLCDASRIQTIPTGLLPNISHLQCLRLDNCMQVNVQTGELSSLGQLEMLGVQFSSLSKFNSYVHTHHWQRLSHYRLQTGDQYVGDSLLYCRQVFMKGYNLSEREEQDPIIVLPTNMQVLEIINCHLPTSLSNLSPSLKGNAIRDLERCKIDECMGIEHLWSFTTTTSSVPQNLQTLVLESLPDLTRLFKYKRVGTRDGPPPLPPRSGTFSSLKLLSVTRCHNLKYLFTPCSVQHHFKNLQLIRIFHCSMKYAVADKEEDDRGTENEGNSIIAFPKLKYLELLCVPKLMSMCRGTKTIICPSLQEIRVLSCPMLRRLPLSTIHMNADGQTSEALPTALCKIIGEPEWWNLLEWDTPQAKSIFQPLFSVPQDVYTMMKDDIWLKDLRSYEEVK
ncbi:hypothetical protein F0562_030626 [Nyssa sinensis]|uniref:Disease resistance protein At4g27190-like leucine-rich repeats domain-containing protein n=1 Tax=Nyssa sinensis TaxID=561372 RepID=A0A5J5AXF1_9ASTE|nr:hypothetical protein F0562_030626 [Nyssa sinensis]